MILLAVIKSSPVRPEVKNRVVDDLVKSRHPVEKGTPGAYKCLRTLDSGFRRNDGKNAFSSFCETIKSLTMPKFWLAKILRQYFNIMMLNINLFFPHTETDRPYLSSSAPQK